MQRPLLGVVLLLCALASACAWSDAERTKFRDDLARETAAAAVAALQEKVAPALKEEVGEIVAAIIKELPVDDERKQKLLTAATDLINDKIDYLISGEVVGAKLEEIFKDVLDKLLPEADPETSGTGAAIGGILLAIGKVALGLKRGG